MLLASAPDAVRPRRDEPARTPVQVAQQIGQLAQVTIERRIIIRIPTYQPRAERSSMMSEEPPPPPPPVRLRETKGPKCLTLGRIRGAVITMADGVTMVTGSQERFRTHFGRACRPADFYSGFYIEPTKDGAICAGRDTLHARNGSTCEIEKFSALVPDESDADEESDERADRPRRVKRPDR